jgi:hypothetical protein
MHARTGCSPGKTRKKDEDGFETLRLQLRPVEIAVGRHGRVDRGPAEADLLGLSELCSADRLFEASESSIASILPFHPRRSRFGDIISNFEKNIASQYTILALVLLPRCQSILT